MSVKALGIALKLTFSGMNQLLFPQTWAFTLVVLSCVITQMNYLNKVMHAFDVFLILIPKGSVHFESTRERFPSN